MWPPCLVSRGSEDGALRAGPRDLTIRKRIGSGDSKDLEQDFSDVSSGPPQAAGGGALSRMPLAPGTLSAMSLIPSLPPCKEGEGRATMLQWEWPLAGAAQTILCPQCS